MKVKIGNHEIGPDPEVEYLEFPKYATQVINLANKNSQGTRPKVVGQMTELFKQFPGTTLEAWEKWYLQKKPEAINAATQKITGMLRSLSGVAGQIDDTMVEAWVRDLVIVKTFKGLRLQKAILKKLAEITNTDYRLSNPKEESKGIDGFVGDTPISVKPVTYRLKPELQENIMVKIVYYTEVEDGIEIEYPQIVG